MENSYNKTIGIARLIWLSISGGVITPAMIKLMTIAIRLLLRSISAEIILKSDKIIKMIGIWKAMPNAMISFITSDKYSLIFASRIMGVAPLVISKLMKKLHALGMTK